MPCCMASQEDMIGPLVKQVLDLRSLQTDSVGVLRRFLFVMIMMNRTSIIGGSIPPETCFPSLVINASLMLLGSFVTVTLDTLAI